MQRSHWDVEPEINRLEDENVSSSRRPSAPILICEVQMRIGAEGGLLEDTFSSEFCLTSIGRRLTGPPQISPLVEEVAKRRRGERGGISFRAGHLSLVAVWTLKPNHR